MDPALELAGVSKRYGANWALRPTDLIVHRGQTTVLVGPSGCGKSTLLRLIVGLVRPDSGRIVLAGAEVTESNLLAVRQRIGYVVQQGGLFPHLTARQNVELLARHLGRAKSDRDRRIEELARLTHFPPDGLDRFGSELSGGQQQRVSLMRALMLNPDVLLLDEPLAALDPMIRHGLQAELRAIFRTLGTTVVLVTHEMGEAAYFADRLVLLREGRIVQQGTLAELRDSPAEPFVNDFFRCQRTVFDTAEDDP